MKQEEYVKTIVVYGKMVNIGIDDNGQQYFLEYVDENGQLIEIGCGAYNFDFEDIAKSFIDYRRFSIEVLGEEYVLKIEKEHEERLKKYIEKEKLDGTSI